MNDDMYKYDYNGLCMDTCPNHTFFMNDTLICLKHVENGFYVEPNSQIILKCDKKCQACNYESHIQNLCITCNTDNEYYPIYNVSNNTYINCINQNIEGFYLDKKSYIYKPCYNTCKTCSKSGDENNNNCMTCIPNHSFYDNNYSNCYKTCYYNYYFDESNLFHCTNNPECPIGYKLINNKSKCIKNCYEDNYYKYEDNKECLLSCPEGKEVYDDKYLRK